MLCYVMLCHGSNISSNAITGTIPSSIKYMTIAQFVDMSKNQLTGGIPAELQFMASLQSLYVTPFPPLPPPLPA